MKRRLVFLYLFSVIELFVWSACYNVRQSKGGGQAGISAQPSIHAADPAITVLPETKNSFAEGSLDDTEPELTVWILRNLCEPGFLPYGKLYLSNMEFRDSERSQLLLMEYSDASFKPATVFGGYSSSNGFGISQNAAPVYKSPVFVPLFGELAPTEGEVLTPMSYEALRVDVNAILGNDINEKGNKSGTPTWLKKCRFEHPIVNPLNPSGDPPFILYFGIKKSGKSGSSALPKTGVVWKISNMKNKQ